MDPFNPIGAISSSYLSRFAHGTLGSATAESTANLIAAPSRFVSPWDHLAGACEYDHDADLDVDGGDLAALLDDLDNFDPLIFSADYGRTDCPADP